MNTSGVFVEQVQVYRGYYSIPKGILLIQKTGLPSFFCVIPRTPFIHIKAQLTVRIILIHDVDIIFQVSFHPISALHGFEPHGVIELGSMPFFLPVAGGKGVEMVTDTIHITVYVCTQNVRPFRIICVTTATHQERPLALRGFDKRGVLTIQVYIVIRVHVTTTTP